MSVGFYNMYVVGDGNTGHDNLILNQWIGTMDLWKGRHKWKIWMLGHGVANSGGLHLTLSFWTEHCCLT